MDYLKVVLKYEIKSFEVSIINVALFSLFLELFRFHELGVRMAGA